MSGESEDPTRLGGGDRSRRLLRWAGIDVYGGETLPALLLFASLFISFAFQYTAKSVRQSTFIDSLGAERLPYVYLLVALCSYPLLRLYGRLADRLTTQGMISTTCGLIAASMVLYWWLFTLASIWVPLSFYIWVTILFVLISSQLWFFAGRLFSPRQAKRLFGFIGAGGLLGSVAGGQLARVATVLGSSRDALLVAAVLVLMIVVLVHPLRKQRWRGDPASSDRWTLGEGDGAATGFSALRASRQLQLISALLVLGVLVAQIVDLQFNWAVESVTGDLDERTVFFGNVFSVMGIIAFLFQLFFASRIHRARGVAFSARVLPSTMVLGTVALLGVTPFVPAAILPIALTLKVGENGLRYSLDQATRELLFMPVPAALRRRAKVFIDVFIQRGAKGLAALLLFPVTFGFITPLEAGWLSLATAAVWLYVAGSASREYVRSFRRRLRQRAVDTDMPINLSDATTLEILVQSLGSSDPRQVIHSLEILAAHGRHALVPPLLLYHDDAEVRLATLKILGHAERQDAIHLVERRLNDPSSDVRAEAVRVLAKLRREDVCELMLPRLAKADPQVRAAAIACLLQHGDERACEQATAVLASMLRDESVTVRVEAAKALGALAEPAFQAELLQLLYDRNPMVVRQTIATIRRRVSGAGPNPIYLPTLISLLQDRRVKHEAREALACFRQAALPALVHYLNDRDESLWVRRAIPKTIASIGAQAARDSLLECLTTQGDAFLRRKLIEALALVGVESARTDVIERQIEVESLGYLSTLVDLYSLGSEAMADATGVLVQWQAPLVERSLLEQLLAARLEDHLRNIFGLLALTHKSALIWSAYRSLVDDRGEGRAHTLEYLDNTLSDAVREQVFAAIGDAPLSLKLEGARRQHNLAPRGRIETVRRYLTREVERDSDDTFLVAAALHLVSCERIQSLYPEVVGLRSAGDAFVRETAEWAAGRIQ